jgi:HD-GYP domain-containing protein (c-di-GMP phosphodiesterase class II)
METHPSFPRHEDPLAILPGRLAESFGVSFDLWRKTARWELKDVNAAPGKPRYFTDDLSELNDVLERADAEQAPVVGIRSNGQDYLAIPFSPPVSGGLIAVAELPITDEHLVQQLAAALIRHFLQGLEMVAKDAELDSLNHQVSNDLEAVTFLLDVAQHIEHCDISRTLEDTASTLLPVLQDLVQAETLVFVRATPRAESDAGTDELAAAMRVGAVPSCGDSMFRQLIAHFGPQAAQRPVVKNRMGGRLGVAEFPGLENLVLVHVGEVDKTVGWLLALNHDCVAPSADGETELPEWGLSHREFGSVEARMMIAVANMLAVQSKNLKLARERESLLIGLLRTLVNTVDAKDPYTCGHSERVATISRRLGEHMGLGRQTCEQLYLSGLLHDIGKIGVPDKVLGKPGKLTDEEFLLIQQHPGRGHSILAHIDHLSHIRETVLHHHEHYDGRGYPHGLAGKDIPLTARIIAVADAYDAMARNRPYRKALPEEKVYSILREGAGTQWDPRIITAFFEVLDEIKQLCASSQQQAREIFGLVQPSPTAAVPPAVDEIAAAVVTTCAPLP